MCLCSSHIRIFPFVVFVKIKKLSVVKKCCFSLCFDDDMNVLKKDISWHRTCNRISTVLMNTSSFTVTSQGKYWCIHTHHRLQHYCIYFRTLLRYKNLFVRFLSYKSIEEKTPKYSNSMSTIIVITISYTWWQYIWQRLFWQKIENQKK